MRARIPTSTLKRLKALEEQKEQRSSVALFPALISLDEWSDLAEQMQAILKENVKTDKPPDYSVLNVGKLVLERVSVFFSSLDQTKDAL